MNDLDVVRTMRADAPVPSADRLAAGRERLRAAVRPRPVHRRRPVLLVCGGGLAVAVAAGAVGVSTGSRDGGYRPAADTEVLDKAAQVVEKQPEPVLKPRQWVYYRFAQYSHGSGTTADDSWIRMDGMQDASVLSGKVVVVTHRRAESSEGTPLGAYRLLAALPTDPRAMLTTLYKKVGSEPRGTTGDQLAFDNIQQLLWNSVAGAPPRVEATLYRALALIPGVKVRSSVEYAPGRTAIAVFRPASHALLLDPATYRMLGWVNVSTGARPAVKVPVGKKVPMSVLPAGTVESSFFRSEVKLVTAPGRR
jgi:hypothetical protein